MTHVVTFTASEVEDIISGKIHFILRFFKKSPEFLNGLKIGDLIYFRKSRGEILGQFEIGKLIIIEKLEIGDWRWIKEVGSEKWDLKKEYFEERVQEDSILIIIQITKLEQFITPPIEIDKKSKKEWIIIES